MEILNSNFKTSIRYTDLSLVAGFDRYVQSIIEYLVLFNQTENHSILKISISIPQLTTADFLCFENSLKFGETQNRGYPRET